MPKTSTTGKSDAGFTLLELLVVLSLIALLMLVALPSIHGGDSRLLGEGVQVVASELRLARMRAIGSMQEVALRPEILRGGYRSRASLPNGLSLNVLDSERRRNLAEIVFFPDGSSNGAVIELNYGGSTAEVTVDWATGRIRPSGRDG